MANPTSPSTQTHGSGISDVSIAISGQSISGWTSVKIRRGLETCPPVFELGLTDRYPAQLADVQIKAGDPCQVMIGGQPVITGYVDRFVPSYDAHTHNIGVAGRGKCADLVDCTQEWPTGQIGGGGVTAPQLATRLAAPYGISVKALSGPGPAIKQFNLQLTDTVWSVIEEFCRYAAFLAYEDETGALVLSQAGTTTAASGFVEGVNVLAARVTNSMDQRYSVINAYLNSMQTLGPVGTVGNFADSETDPNVPRHRLKAIVTEAPSGGQNIAKMRAQWEIARRLGRSVVVDVTVDSWRDSAGALWTPNTLAQVTLPGLHLPTVQWLIGDVAFLRDAHGTSAEVRLMDPKAFLPEPILLQPIVPGVKYG